MQSASHLEPNGFIRAPVVLWVQYLCVLVGGGLFGPTNLYGQAATATFDEVGSRHQLMQLFICCTVRIQCCTM